MDLSYTPEEEAFRARVRAWVEANVPAQGSPGPQRRACPAREYHRPLLIALVAGDRRAAKIE